MLTAKTLTIAALAVLFCQCASGPAVDRRITLTAGSRTAIAYQTADGSINQETINQTALTKSEAEERRKQNPGVKVLPEAEMQHLADRLGGEGFFELAQTSRNPTAKSWVIVEHEGKQYIFTNVVNSFEDAATFNRCLNAFMDVYNANDSFVGSKMSTADLKRAGQAINDASRSVRDGKQRKNQNP